MINAKYSILFCNKQLSDYIDDFDSWLMSGIKIIWLGSTSDLGILKNKYKEFVDAHLLQIYELKYIREGIIVDGNDEEELVGLIKEECPTFNSEQYLIEHSRIDNHIIVHASAGTGKTTVMIDRIMFLLHMNSDLHMPDICMITFTNDAAKQMSKKLQEILYTRYKLTKNRKYLVWLEEQTQMKISTIHSFAYFLLKEYGVYESFTPNLSIKSFQYERNELIKNTLSSRVNEDDFVENQLGLSFYDANSLVGKFWEKLSQVGVGKKDIQQLDWGNPEDSSSRELHSTLEENIQKLEKEYSDIKMQEEAVAINDIVRDLLSILQNRDLPQTNITLKYIFIDEFQDSDVAQIKTASILVDLFEASLFVVGDVKQSIYGFRGATENAFNILKSNIKVEDCRKIVDYTLVNNYRTSANVLKEMEVYFERWTKEGYLNEIKHSVPFVEGQGKFELIKIKGKGISEYDMAIEKQIRNELKDLNRRIRQKKIKKDEKARVVVLTRSNNELYRIMSLLQRCHIPAIVKKNSSFYTSETVRDFFVMITSFLFFDDAKSLFNFFLTPYAGDIGTLNVNEMEILSGDNGQLLEYLIPYLNKTIWKKYHQNFRIRPVLAVIKELIDEVNVIASYAAECIKRGSSNTESSIKTRQYKANLEKLMAILQSNFGGKKTSLYDIYKFLKINIATNRTEDEVDIETINDYSSVLCMTVHKSKGLEFETVIIPYTNQTWGNSQDSAELLYDMEDNKVGWIYSGISKITNEKCVQKNDNYDELHKEEIVAICREETRILYVAMTRTITNLICICQTPGENPDTWANLLL